MDFPTNYTNVDQAADDLRRRSLAHMAAPLERMIYLGSTRDYNTGLYYHDGLSSRFSEMVACQALANCHREAYQQVLQSSIQSTNSAPLDFIAAWKNLQPYRVAVPAETDPLAAEFLCSNVKIALSIWESHQGGRSRQPLNASLPQ
jgi:hypothetical protein